MTHSTFSSQSKSSVPIFDSDSQKKSGNYIKNRVSIVTPVYNGEKHISRFLESILKQTWNEIEMILVDDGSNDNTVKIAESYRKKFENRGFTFHMISAEHKNASAAINHGLPLVTGEFLIWPDSDDVLKSDSIKKRIEFLQTHQQYQCVRSLSYYVDEQTGERADADEKRGDLKEERLFFPILEFRTYVCCGCYMLRTQPFFEIYPDRKIPEYDVGQNFQMLLPFMYLHPCAVIQEELYVVYKRQGSHSRRTLTKQEEEKKYADYEKLIDEIAGICHINDKNELQRICYWKQNRRFLLNLKYNNKKAAVKALICMFQCHGLDFKTLIFHILYIFFGARIQKFSNFSSAILHRIRKIAAK